MEKYLILGLNNSGKTSILLSLRTNANLFSFFSLKPTKGINIERYDLQESEVHIWDFGGQEQYRKDHVINLPKYLEGVNKIVQSDKGKSVLLLTHQVLGGVARCHFKGLPLSAMWRDKLAPGEYFRIDIDDAKKQF